MKKYIAIAMLSLAVAACNQNESTSNKSQESVVVPALGVSGTYSSGKDTFIFSSDGKVTLKNNLVSDKIAAYTIESGKVTVKSPQGFPIVLTINSDGSLTSDSQINYKKTD
ncbi:hypothetical protein [Cupriavidus nantongensis]|uniref:hypothetical protein n=1 Tax=Cupriavidus nantongensis TaxID=1796606 RepID=UPI0012375B53|nr:hypothetical protein [Cupriavidus nantongensis]